MARKKRSFGRDSSRSRKTLGKFGKVFSSNALARLLPVASIARNTQTSPKVLKKYTPLHSVRVERTSPTRPVFHFNILDPFTSVCKERKQRREVLFAKRNVGKGVRIHTKKTFSIKSNIRCK